MAEEIDAVKKRRSIIRRHTTKLITKVTEVRENRQYVEIRVLEKYFEQLRERNDELKDLDKVIFEYKLRTADEDACEQEFYSAIEYNDKILSAKEMVEDQIQKLEKAEGSVRETEKNERTRENARQDDSDSETQCVISSSAPSIEGSVLAKAYCHQQRKSRRRNRDKMKVKLPKINMARFSGKIHEWQGFWDCFCSAIHDNPELAEVDKLQYLKGALDESAAFVIAGIPMTDASYSIAIDLLKKRFRQGNGCENLISHLTEMISMVSNTFEHGDSDSEMGPKIFCFSIT